MTQNDIIEMARQTQMPFYWRTGEITYLDKLENFAKLVAQHEREACSSIASDYAQRLNSMTAVNIADAIRARGKA
jgi:hypothetical protein